jgi:methyl-accepting chemotaxis protein
MQEIVASVQRVTDIIGEISGRHDEQSAGLGRSTAVGEPARPDDAAERRAGGTERRRRRKPARAAQATRLANLQQTASSMEQLTSTVRTAPTRRRRPTSWRRRRPTVAQRGGQVVSQVVVDHGRHQSPARARSPTSSA